ncbi:SLBB domain-containing protein [Taibaiella chishuiensis]|uniref:Protein involved in polysaccharide export with SLBB domain n=1 Tax=Taibaiella chishuiensis TaxID=1434707 RepID=A0A2P8DB34_9BACT|nr:SLBB domain-containing protein [Taibaiella chishuiensis]PSK94436.1 protein involved in polysaccharide export with SLBB domain [Taibaiella chishuiensis]
MSKKYFFNLVRIFCFALFLAIPPVLHAQNIDRQNLSNIKVDELSDVQIMAIRDQILASGQKQEDVEKILIDRGMASEEVTKFKGRMSSLKEGSLDFENKEAAKTINGKKELAFEKPVAKDMGLRIFGSEYFENATSNFAPNTNRPTPQNYIVGPGDKLQINVFGNSVVNWNLEVNAEGSILLPGMGNVFVGGKTIENATQMIKDRLRANSYAIGNGTDVNISLSNIRTIRVNINGEVKRPGPINISSLSTLLNALYESGGPNSIGSLRSIELYRHNSLIRRVDIYDYILRGDKSGDILLEDDDIINVPPYRVRVALEGEVKRPALYEVMPGESLKDVLLFSGGFNDKAYTASVKALQLTDKGKRVKDINASEFDSYVPLKGDHYTVEPILDRFENRVTLNGSVFRPGQFELQAGLTLSELIKRADGLKEDAYPDRGYITRLKGDNTTEVIPFNVKGVVDGTAEDIALKREDIITIPSIFDLRETYKVTIAGSVRRPGSFPYDENITVEDLILRAGGFADGADMKRVEIARRVKDSDRRAKDAKLAEIFNITIDPKLTLAESKFKLQPYDVVSVYSLPGFVTPQIVTIEGEVMMPGSYAMISKDERISDLIKRANGFTAYAYLKGASLKRGDVIETQSDAEKRDLKLAQFRQKQTEATKGAVDANLENPTKRNNFVGIDLEYIIQHPKGRKDAILLNGDVINVPRVLQTVKISGEVFSPITTMYTPNQGLNEYVLNSGGFTEDAFKRKSYVVYANGSIKGTRHFLFFRNYPNIEPGAEIFIPKRKQREKAANTAQMWIGLGTSMASLAAVIFGIITVANNNK